MQFEGRYFDGETGLRLDVFVQVDPETSSLDLNHPEVPLDRQHWRFDQLRALRDEAREGVLTMTLRADTSDDSALIDLPRLTIRDAGAIALLTRVCPDLFKRDLPKGTAWRVTSRIGMAVGAIALMIFVIIPAMAGTMATLIPIERETAWGKSVVAQMERFFGGDNLGELRCTNEAGLAALDTMVERLTSQTNVAYDLNVSVFDHGMVNAFAAPGGQVVLMRGLIEKAETAEEVAAVLGHEIGHVEHRDATRNTLRAAGSAGILSMVLGDFTGGSAAVIIAETMLSTSYTREAEAEADVYAMDMLNNAGVSADGMAVFFDGLSDLGGLELPEYLSSHPATDLRANAARNFAAEQGDTSPILTDAEWQALRGVCD